MLHSDRANIALRVNCEKRVLIQIARLGNLRHAKLNVQGLNIGKIANLHGVKLRSFQFSPTHERGRNRLTGIGFVCIEFEARFLFNSRMNFKAERIT